MEVLLSTILLIRSYYLLTKKFVEVVFSTFNNHKIESLVYRSNKEVIKFFRVFKLYKAERR